MAILATVAFGTRVTLDDVWHTGIEEIEPLHMRAAHELEMAVRLVGAATLVDGRYDVRVQPAFVDRHHPLAAVEGPFNAVMLQGDAIREITLAGPGAGGLETASAVVSDMISVIGTTGTGFLQNDACWRELEQLPHGDVVSPFYVHLEVDDRPGVLADVARRLATHEVSVARLVQHETGEGTAALHVVLHECRSGALVGRARRDRAAVGDAPAADRAAGDLRPRRPRARLGIERSLGAAPTMHEEGGPERTRPPRAMNTVTIVP